MLERVLYHDHCFDGAASAAYFSRFIAGAIHPDAEFRYTGMAHKASQMFDPALFDGDENAIVDFKYSSDPRLTWWFDHHQSAFLNAEDAEHFRRDTSGRKLYDPSYKSCTSFIAKVACDRFGFRAPDLDDLVDWSLIIDGAQYPDARTAVELGAPAMKLTLVIEAAKGSDIVQKIIGWMQQRQLAEIIAEPEIQALYEPLYQRHLENQRDHQEPRPPGRRRGVLRPDRIRRGGLQQVHSVLSVPDRHLHGVGEPVESFAPRSRWARIPGRPKSPRTTWPRICERYGGGGHARVGAISLEPGAWRRPERSRRRLWRS